MTPCPTNVEAEIVGRYPELISWCRQASIKRKASLEKKKTASLPKILMRKIRNILL